MYVLHINWCRMRSINFNGFFPCFASFCFLCVFLMSSMFPIPSHPATITTRIITSWEGNPYYIYINLFVTVAGWWIDPTYNTIGPSGGGGVLACHLRTLGCGPITIFVCSCEICHFAVEISCFHDSGGCGIRATRTFGNNEDRGTSSACCFFWGGVARYVGA